MISVLTRNSGDSILNTLKEKPVETKEVSAKPVSANKSHTPILPTQEIESNFQAIRLFIPMVIKYLALFVPDHDESRSLLLNMEWKRLHGINRC